MIDNFVKIFEFRDYYINVVDKLCELNPFFQIAIILAVMLSIILGSFQLIKLIFKKAKGFAIVMILIVAIVSAMVGLFIKL